MRKVFMGYKIANVSDTPRYPLYGIFNPQGECVDKTAFPTDFHRAVWRDKYASAKDIVAKRKVFADLMTSLGTSYRYGIGCVEKVWNRGQGRLSMFKLYPESGVILVNKYLRNSYDDEHLEELMDILGDQAFSVTYANYGYPDYYHHDFGLKYAE